MRSTTLRRVLASLLCLGLVMLTAMPAAAGTGNRGTVKVRDIDQPQPELPANDPYVCNFYLALLGTNPGQSGEWQIYAHPPTGSGQLVLSGSYSADRAGDARMPTAGTLRLPDGHYHLSVDGRNAHNAKHKTFWVSCPQQGTETSREVRKDQPVLVGQPPTSPISLPPVETPRGGDSSIRQSAPFMLPNTAMTPPGS